MFKVIKVESETQMEKVIDSLNQEAKMIYDTELYRVLSQLENETQKAIYLDWWNSGSLWQFNKETGNCDRAEKYQQVCDHDWETVYGFIMETISKGMGQFV